MKADYKTTGLQGITDLTVLAPVRREFVDDAFDAETKVERLRRVLTVLNAIRQASRESALQPSPFADSVGQFMGIHFFRFGLVTPSDAGSAEPHRLFLNVTFDGGWEAYLRTIWGPLGTLLDLMYCNCEGYPIAFESSFETYTRWVRDNEVPSSFFYADSAVTVADRHYLTQLAALHRERGGRADADALLTSFAVAGKANKVVATPDAVTTSIRVLKALAGLRPLFPRGVHGEPGDARFLSRFAVDLLADLRSWITQGLFDPGQQFESYRPGFAAELDWLMAKADVRTPTKVGRPDLAPSGMQSGIATSTAPAPNGVHGALVLLRVTEADSALDWLSTPGRFASGQAVFATDVVLQTVAVTYNGLRALGVPTEELERLPREFVEGMEARAGVLGDVRGNHPLSWERPLRHGAAAGAPRVELSAVHVVVQLRTAAQSGDPLPAGENLLPRLEPSVAALHAPGTGLKVIVVQAMQQTADDPRSGSSATHFGFADGISQPTLADAERPPRFWSDKVGTGELFIGHGNNRGDMSIAPSDAIVDQGSFLVIRKLRQDTRRLNRLVQQAAARLVPDSPAGQAALVEVIRSKMMGRRSDGSSLVATSRPSDNDFDYRNDSEGRACPFASHVRRANPREARPLLPPPRIARRGMSYGNRDDADHGTVFMAYNASIAEQYEVIQRWLSGANSSGVSSADADPFLGVPQRGQSRLFAFMHEDKVYRLDLGDEPLVKLLWGMYAFVPSLDVLARLKRIVATQPKAGPPDESKPLPRGANDLRLLLEDGRSRVAAWEAVRMAPVVERESAPGVVSRDYGLLVGSASLVREVLTDDGARFSARGYGDRMKGSIGLGFLGQDNVKAADGSGDDGHADASVEAVNRAVVDTIGQEAAFTAANRVASLWLDQTSLVDFGAFGSAVIAALCKEWFGLPDGAFVVAGPRSDEPNDGPPRCPGHLLAVSRYVFAPHTTDRVAGTAKPQGQAFRDAVGKFLRARPVPAGAVLTNAIVAAMAGHTKQRQADTVAGIMLGFPATVLGNLVTVLMAWNASRRLWDLQHVVLDDPNLESTLARTQLREALLETMRSAPVPYVDWRTAAVDGSLGGVDFKQGQKVIVGLGSAVSESSAERMLMFGGARSETVHACPGYDLAVGVMLGCTTALLNAGTLRPTADPRTLTLSRIAQTS